MLKEELKESLQKNKKCKEKEEVFLLLIIFAFNNI